MADEQDDREEDLWRLRNLRCHGCGESVQCSAGDILRYTQVGWPMCCGETMTLVIEAKFPGGAKP